MKTELKQHLNNSMVFEVKYIKPTESTGSYLIIKSNDFGPFTKHKPKSLNLSYSYEFQSSTDQAQAWLESKGFEIIAKNCNLPKIDIFVCKWDFEKLADAFGVKFEV